MEEAEIDIENLEAHKYVPDEVRAQLMEKYKHPITRDLEENAKKVGGHGGMDYMMDYRLVYCLRNGLPLDMDGGREDSDAGVKHKSSGFRAVWGYPFLAEG